MVSVSVREVFGTPEKGLILNTGDDDDGCFSVTSR